MFLYQSSCYFFSWIPSIYYDLSNTSLIHVLILELCYNLSLFGDCWQQKQGKHKIAYNVDKWSTYALGLPQACLDALPTIHFVQNIASPHTKFDHWNQFNWNTWTFGLDYAPLMPMGSLNLKFPPPLDVLICTPPWSLISSFTFLFSYIFSPL